MSCGEGAMKGRNLGWGLEIWGLIKCKSKVGLGHFDKSAGPLAHCTTAISNCEYSEIRAVLYSSRSYKEPNTGHCTNDSKCTAGQDVICSGEKLCSEVHRWTNCADLSRFDSRRPESNSSRGSLGVLHVFARCHIQHKGYDLQQC